MISIFEIYSEGLKDIPGILFHPVVSWAEVSPWLFPIVIDSKKSNYTREKLIQRLSEEGIESRPFFTPVHSLPAFRETSICRGDRLPITDHLCRVGMNLPTYNNMTIDEVERVIEVIRSLK